MDEEKTSTELVKLVVPEHVDFEVIKTSLAPSIDKLIDRANTTVAKIAGGIKDDETMALAVQVAESLRDNGQDFLKSWREKFYVEEWYRPGEERREFFDSRIKPIAAHMKSLMAAVSDYKNMKERQAKLAREKAEAEARRQREEAERKAREAQEAIERAKRAEEEEKRRKEEAAAAEARRVLAEKEAQERREREAREAAAAETKRRLEEEERARIAHAEVAQAEGNGAAKVDTILESATPIAPVLGKAEQAKSAEDVRLEQEAARKANEEKARKEREAVEEAERKRKEAEAEAYRLKQEADAAAAAATAATAAAAATVTKKQDTGTTSVTRWKWDLDSDGTEAGDAAAVMAILTAIVNKQLPITYCGYNPKRPQDFRPSIIQEDVNDLTDRFKAPGIRAYPQQDEQLKRRVVGGHR